MPKLNFQIQSFAQQEYKLKFKHSALYNIVRSAFIYLKSYWHVGCYI